MTRGLLTLALALLSWTPDPAAQGRNRGRVDNEPSRLVTQYVELDTTGGQLTDEGWQAIAALFIEPGPRHRGELQVYEEYGVFDSLYEAGADHAEVGVQGRAFGAYDPRTGRYHTDKFPGPIYTKGSVQVVRVGGHWKIKGPVSPPIVTWQTVLRLATELRDTTTRAVAAAHRLPCWAP